MKIIMVDPYNYGLDYVLPDNEEMQKNFGVNPPDKEKAVQQWNRLHDIYCKLNIEIEIIKSEKDLSDMVFVANAGLPHGATFILSNFRYEPRMLEQAHYFKFFSKTHGIVTWDKHCNFFFEGQGDALWAEDRLLVGYGFRTAKATVEILREIIEKTYDIISLELQTDIAPTRFYHLDTALAYLGRDNFLVCREAFTEKSFKKIENLGNLILVDAVDANRLVCNAVTIGKKIIMQTPSPALKEKLEKYDYEVISVDTSEFIKSGGSVKCLTLILD